MNPMPDDLVCFWPHASHIHTKLMPAIGRNLSRLGCHADHDCNELAEAIGRIGR